MIFPRSAVFPTEGNGLTKISLLLRQILRHRNESSNFSQV